MWAKCVANCSSKIALLRHNYNEILPLSFSLSLSLGPPLHLIASPVIAIEAQSITYRLVVVSILDSPFSNLRSPLDPVYNLPSTVFCSLCSSLLSRRSPVSVAISKSRLPRPDSGCHHLLCSTRAHLNGPKLAS